MTGQTPPNNEFDQFIAQKNVMNYYDELDQWRSAERIRQQGLVVAEAQKLLAPARAIADRLTNGAKNEDGEYIAGTAIEPTVEVVRPNRVRNIAPDKQASTLPNANNPLRRIANNVRDQNVHYAHPNYDERNLDEVGVGWIVSNGTNNKGKSHSIVLLTTGELVMTEGIAREDSLSPSVRLSRRERKALERDARRRDPNDRLNTTSRREHKLIQERGLRDLLPIAETAIDDHGNDIGGINLGQYPINPLFATDRGYDYTYGFVPKLVEDGHVAQSSDCARVAINLEKLEMSMRDAVIELIANNP